MAIPTLRIGSRGPDVLALQRALNAAAPFVRLSEDGDYGHHTYLEVSHYQRAAGLTIDGVAGPRTLAALGLTAAPHSDPAPQTQPTGAYLTPLDDIAPPAWVRIGSALLTREPLRSRSTGLYARLTYQGALDACAALGASLATPDDVQALHDAAAAGRAVVEVAPVTLPTVAMVRGAGFAGSVNSAEFQAAAQALRVASMRSIEWCRAHDALVAERLAAAGWDGRAAVAGAGKHWVAGAPPGRAYLMGWWTPQGWIQPRPAVGSQGPHDRGHSDYGTTIVARRSLPASDGAEPTLAPGQVPRVRTPVLLATLRALLALTWREVFNAVIEPERARMVLAHWCFEHGVASDALRASYCNNFGNVMARRSPSPPWFAMDAEEIDAGRPVVHHSAWRAYASPTEGIEGYLRTMARSFPRMLDAMASGDALAVATAGKAEGYFTAGLQVYAARLGAWYARLAP